MNILSILKYFVPVGLMKWQQKIALNRIFRGVYRKFGEAPARGPGFQGSQWIETCRIGAARLLIEQKERLVLSGRLVHADLLSLLAEILEESNPLRVLDFGGGLGFTYIPFKDRLSPSLRFDYHVVENSALCAAGRALFKNDGQIKFLDSIPDSKESYHIIFASSVFQYIENFQTCVEKMMDLRPRYLFFSDFSAVMSGPTVYTSQYNIKGSIIPYQFVNFNELLSFMESGSYKLLHKSISTQPAIIEFARRYHCDVEMWNLIFEKVERS